jgi:predicted permease
MRDWAAYVRQHLPELHVSPEREAEIVRELAGQLEDVYRDAVSAGLGEQEALALVRAQFPDWAALAREIRSAEGWHAVEAPVVHRAPLLAGLLHDVRYSLRQTASHPGFYALAVATLGFGIALNTAMFTIADTMAIHPLPYPQPERLVAVETIKTTEPEAEQWTSPPDFVDLKRRARSFDSIAAISPVWSVTLTGRGDAERLECLFVSPELFQMAGVSAAVGRLFGPSENVQGDRSSVVVLSHAYWKSHFGGHRDVIGKVITVDGTRVTIVGVLPADFVYVGEPLSRAHSNIDIWAPLLANPTMNVRRSVRLLKVIARLRDGVTAQAATQEVHALSVALGKEYPDSNRIFDMRVRPLEEQAAGPLKPALYLLLASVGVVLLIACTNVSGLLLARAVARRREVAVRWALGASVPRLVQQIFTESAVVALASGIIGIAVSYGLLQYLLSTSPDGFIRPSIRMNWRALLVSGGAIFLCAIACALPGVWRLFRSEVADTLRSAGRALTAGHARIRATLVAAQIAAAAALLIASGLLIRSFISVLQVDPGVATTNLISLATQVPPGTRTPEQRTAFYTKAKESIRAVPGIRDVAAVTRLPMGGQHLTSWISIEGRPATNADKPEVEYRGCTPNYFDVAGIPVIRGRAFTEADRPGAFVVINETAARRYFPNEDPVGKRIAIGQLASDSPWTTIAGVVGDIRHFGLDVEPRPELYRPYAYNPMFSPVVLVRTSDESAATVSALMAAVRAASPDSPVYNVYRMRELVAKSLQQRRFLMWLLMAFAAAAALLAAIGLYGVIAESVLQRTREIGVRVALGASPSGVLRLIVGEATRLAVLGVAAGCVAAAVLSRLMVSLLFRVHGLDPISFIAAPLLLAAVAIIAALIPARRATRVDPVIALRQE